MKGLVKYALGPEGVALRELPDPLPEEGELKVKVLAASICGSDMHAINDERSVTMPVILGHEYVGQVIDTCGDTGDFKKGDWILTLPACYSCGTCDLCRAGMVTLCKNRRSIGSHRNGAMADHLIVPAKYSYKVPSSSSDPRELLPYALTEPLACVVHGIYEKISVKPGDTVVVSGPGIMGQLASEVFKTAGAYVIVSGLPVDEDKLELAKELGADKTVTSLEELKEEVYARNPAGADITCEATGLTPSLKACMQVVRPLGTHLQLGLFGGNVSYRLDDMFDREVRYIPSYSSTTTAWDITLKLLSENRITLKPFVSMVTSLDNWEEAFEAVRQKKIFKALLIPGCGSGVI